MDEDIIFPTKEEFIKYSQNCVLIDQSELTNVDVVNSKLILYLKTIANHIQIFINKDLDVYQFGQYLINSWLFEYNKQFCVSKMLSILKISVNSGIELNLNFFINYILLLECKNDSDSLQLIMDFDGFRVIYQCLKNNLKVISPLVDQNLGTVLLLKKLITIQLDLLFQLCKYLTISAQDLSCVDQFVIDYIFKSLIVAYNEEDFYNSSKFKFILALNEQFMVNRDASNPIFSTIRHFQKESRNFIDCLLIYFNRENDKVLQIMISKVLYLIFTHKETSDMFYSNDLNVLVDVLIRELTNLENDEISIKNTFLRVLFPILNNEQFANTLYKRDQLLSMLEFLSGESSNFFKQNETTERLAKKCLSIDWLKNQKQDSEIQSHYQPQVGAPLSLVQSNDSSNSLNSMSKKRPPIPLPRKLLRKPCPPIPSPRLAR